ncbi:MAG: GNAT family N-acetyltransferase [Clostridia bacterium]|nr:GNAT family N-acetyltransferase [Clostridia bacterium]
MSNIRRAKREDLARIAEIEVFNYRLNFYPVFQNDSFYFDELQVCSRMKEYENDIDRIWVYDDGVVKGFAHIDRDEVKKLFVEPVLQGRGIGAALLNYAVREMNVTFLWALEKNVRAIAFYQKHGFRVTDDRKLEEDTDEYLVRLER